MVQKMHIRHLKLGGGIQVALILVNAVFFLLGVAVVAVGIFAAADGAQYDITNTVSISNLFPEIFRVDVMVTDISISIFSCDHCWNRGGGFQYLWSRRHLENFQTPALRCKSFSLTLTLTLLLLRPPSSVLLLQGLLP